MTERPHYPDPLFENRRIEPEFAPTQTEIGQAPGTLLLGPPPSSPLAAEVGADRPSAEQGASAEANGRARRVSMVVAAFLAGAALSAGSFGLGQLSVDQDAANQDSANPDSVTSENADGAGGPQLGAGPATKNADSGPDGTGTDGSGGIASSLSVTEVAATIGPSVVQVETNRGLGSGVVYADGFILTNHHVIDGATAIRIRTSDGRTFDTDLVGSDARNDIAVLTVGGGTDLPVASLAIGQQLLVGEVTVAIGSPFQLQQTVTAGIVSALHRPVPNNGGGFSAMIQTDAPINPGNSGGALANSRGQVIGINTSIRTDGSSNSNVGIGFAVPIDTAVSVAERIVSGASLDVGVLGVQAASAPDDDIGVVLGQITPDGAAATAGLVEGDRVLAVDGAPVTGFAELVGLVQSHFGGDEIDITVLRAGQAIDLQATLS